MSTTNQENEQTPVKPTTPPPMPTPIKATTINENFNLEVEEHSSEDKE